MQTQHQILATVKNPKGIHARPSAKLVEAASAFDAEIIITYNDFRANAKSLLDILSLAAVCDAELRIEAIGQDASKALETMKAMIESQFDFD